MTQIIVIFVREKVSLHRMKIRTFHESFALLSAILIIEMVKKFEVMRTCTGSVAMATIYVVMFGLTIYECGKHM